MAVGGGKVFTFEPGSVRNGGRRLRGMPIAHRLASALKRKDQAPNIELAIDIVEAEDCEATRELAELLATGTKSQRHEALKVLYEIGYREPAMLAPHIELLFDELDSSNNRTLWGAMIALSTLVAANPTRIMKGIDQLMDAAERSSVIAKYHMVKILVALAALPRHHNEVMPHLFQMVESAAINQFPTYAERAAEVLIQPSEAKRLITLIEARHFPANHAAKARRMAKLVRSLRT